MRSRAVFLLLSLLSGGCDAPPKAPAAPRFDSTIARLADSAVTPAAIRLDLTTSRGREQLDDDLLHAVAPGDTVRLDLALSPDQVRDLPSVLSDGWWVALTYRRDDGSEAGSELHILFGPDGRRGDLVIDSSAAPARLRGRITIREVRGPHQGLMAIIAVPVE